MNDADIATESVFTCVRCGDCCRGGGGIVLREREAARVAAFLDMAVADFCARFTETARGKMRLRAGSDGRCVFAGEKGGCEVHAVKPDVCRAWPFFRGNLVDPVSLGMASQGCPGIAKNTGFAEFTRAGARYLLARELFALETEAPCPSALMKESALRRMVRCDARETQ